MGIQINGQTDTISAIDGGITVATDLTVPGVLSYDDVTSIDSVGVITARSGLKVTSGGIHVTAGNVGIGTDESYGDGNASFSSLSLGGNGTKFGLLEINKSDGTAGSWIDCYGTGGNGDLRITTAGTSGAITFWTGGSFTEKLRISSSGNLGIGTDNPYARNHIEIDVNAGAGSGSAGALWLKNANQTANNSATIFFGNNVSQAAGAINFIHKDYSTNAGDITFDTRANGSTYAERLRITSSGALNLSSPSSTVAAGLLNVPNGSRATTTSGVYVTGNGGIVDMARYEMIDKCITSFPANNNKICAINGAPLYINDSRDTWNHYSALPNYLLGTLTHDCINNSSFSVTLACTMTVFLGRSNGWNAVNLSGWNLIESNTNIAPFGSSTRLYVRTFAAGTHNFDNDSAMYFFSI